MPTLPPKNVTIENLTVSGLGGTCFSVSLGDAMDQLLGVDGKDEFTLYLAPVGKIADELA